MNHSKYFDTIKEASNFAKTLKGSFQIWARKEAPSYALEHRADTGYVVLIGTWGQK